MSTIKRGRNSLTQDMLAKAAQAMTGGAVASADSPLATSGGSEVPAGIPLPPVSLSMGEDNSQLVGGAEKILTQILHLMQRPDRRIQTQQVRISQTSVGIPPASGVCAAGDNTREVLIFSAFDPATHLFSLSTDPAFSSWIDLGQYNPVLILNRSQHGALVTSAWYLRAFSTYTAEVNVIELLNRDFLTE